MDDTGTKPRGKLFDDLAGMAGGAFSAVAGLRTEAEAAIRSQTDALVTRLQLVRREELDAAMEVAARARGQAAALALRVAALEAKFEMRAAPDTTEESLDTASSAAPAAVHPAAVGGTTPEGSSAAVASGGIPGTEAVGQAGTTPRAASEVLGGA